MSAPLSHTPEGRVFADPDSPPAKVARRRVLYVPGYDPEGETRYRMLFVREFIRHARRFGLKRRDISKVEALPHVPSVRWRVGAEGPDWSTETLYEVLRWDDIVLRDFRRPLPNVAILLFAGLIYALTTGMITRFFRLHWKFGGVILYPSVLIALVLLAGFGAGWGVAALAGLVFGSLPGLARATLVGATMIAVFAAFYPVGKRWFTWHLMHDWVFNWQHGMGWRPDYDARVERFARHLVAAAGEGGVDELLVVGHSSGSTFAVEIVGRALELDPEIGKRVRLSFLTIGTCTPLVALNPVSRVYRERMARLMVCPDIFWVEYQAPQDWINFIGFAPIRDVKTSVRPEECRNPVVRSPVFSRIVAARTYREIVWKPFRMHFQFLVANDELGEYDYIMIACGPITLEDRVRLGEAAGPLVLGPVPRRDEAA